MIFGSKLPHNSVVSWMETSFSVLFGLFLNQDLNINSLSIVLRLPRMTFFLFGGVLIYNRYEKTNYKFFVIT